MDELNKIKYFEDLTNLFNSDYFDFMDMVSHKFNEKEAFMVKKAYDTASSLHSGQKRKSGEEYIIHPLKVAYALLVYGFDYETVCAALLHDTVEDTSYTNEELEHDFNKNIAVLVDGVTKMKGSKFLSKEETKLMTHEKIMNSITKDARIIAIKLADRLHNMYTLDYLPRNKQLEIANETKDFYINLSRILGIYQVKEQLQDLCLFYINKELFLEYYDIRMQIKKESFESYRKISRDVQKRLDDINVFMDYIYKVKNVGAIYEKSVLEGISLDKVHDLVAIKMMVNEVEDCYKTLNVIENNYDVVPNSVLDMIKEPKYNGYSTLNVSVKTNAFYNTELKIRTYKMQRQNELGMVSNWNRENQKLLNEKCSFMIDMYKDKIHSGLVLRKEKSK